MTAKTFIVAVGALAAFGISPALAGGDCPWGHASKATIADAQQSTPADAEVATSIPYPVPTLETDTQTASVEDSTTTTE